MSDIDRWEFLVALDRSDVKTTPWEAAFVRKMVQNPGFRMSIKQASVVDKMINKYAQKVKEW